VHVKNPAYYADGDRWSDDQIIAHELKFKTQELAATAGLVSLIANTPGEVRSLQLVQLIRDRPVRSVGDQGQATQNVLDMINIDDRIWSGLIEELGSGVGSLPPPIWLSPAGWYKSYSQYLHLGA
jgi:hypothetical protein